MWISTSVDLKELTSNEVCFYKIVFDFYISTLCAGVIKNKQCLLNVHFCLTHQQALL